MCILFFIVNENAKGDEYKLILASNRDEYYTRPALIADRWKDDEHIFGGRDMTSGREGGTWLAFSTKNNTFKLGALLNINGEKVYPDAAPRGNIVKDYVQNSISNAEYCRKLAESTLMFNNFHLVTIEIGSKLAQTIHYTNVDCKVREWPQNEVLGFSNSLSDVPYKKVQAGREKFKKIVERTQSKDELVASLIDLLSHRGKFWPDDELQRRSPSWCESLSSICVEIPEHSYGTRTHTVILVDANNNVDFYEKTMGSTNPRDDWKRTHIKTHF